MADRPRYHVEQLDKYYDRICFPRDFRLFRVPSADQFPFLQLLLKYQLIHVPFENLTLHYSWHRTVNITPEHLYEKIVEERRGGYCMENNTFFHTVLLSLGYNVYMTGARVYNPKSSTYGGLSHCLNIVTVGDMRYAVDVGFGSRNPIRPLELIHGVEHRSDMGCARLRFDSIPQALRQDQKIWIYEFQKQNGVEWTPQYCFLDVEFLPEDIRVLNWSPSRSPTSFFTHKILCTRFISTMANAQGVGRDMDDDGEIHGVVILDDKTLEVRSKDRLAREQVLNSEDQRLDTLLKWFGIVLCRQDERAIRGTASEIVG